MAVYHIFTLFAFLSCASVTHGGPLIAVADFDQGGVVGTITFTRLDNGSTQIDTSFTSGNFSGWHVHEFPLDYTDDPAARCGVDGAGGHYDPTGRIANPDYSTDCNPDNPLECEAGDLSGKFDALVVGERSFIDSDPILQLVGRYGIIGRSVVVHAPDGSRIACANIILQDDTTRIYVATFVGPVAGSIYFRQSTEEPEIGTFIYARLFYSNGVIGETEGHLWGLHAKSLSILEYSQGVCSNLGQVFNPANISSSPGCDPSNISNCVVGDLSGKLGTITVSDNPIGATINAWTDGNLHMYDISGLSVGLRVSNGGQALLACANIEELPVHNAIVDIGDTLFTIYQQSPFDPTVISTAASIPGGSYQINQDGNIRDDGSTTCYSNEVFRPFEPFQTDAVATFDTNIVGDLSGKHSITGGAMLSDTILPLSNLYSALGRNVMLTPSSGTPTCGTLSLNSGSNVRTVRASAGFDGNGMSGYVRLVQTIVFSNNKYIPGPTLLYWQIRYNTSGMPQTEGHNWHVHMLRTVASSPSTQCGVVGGHFNPFSVEVGSDVEMQACPESEGSRNQLRCELGDLSGKHGWLNIRGFSSSQETTVATDSNLPLTGPYTVFGRSIAIHSHIDSSQIIACANIEPEVLSNIALKISFPFFVDDSNDIQVSLPVAIVDALNVDSIEYGEVLVYELVTDSLRADPRSECYVATLRFTDFDGGNADNIANRVRQLQQDSLPSLYQSDFCPQLDLGREGGGSSSAQPHIFVIVSLMGVMIMLGNIMVL